MNDLYYAKSNPLESIEQHILLTLDGYNSFLQNFGKYFSEEEKYLIYLAIRYHDCGKQNLEFQNKIRNVVKLPLLEVKEHIEEIPHGYLSPAFFPDNIRKQMKTDDKKILFNTIVYHHTRNYEFNKNEIRNYIKTYLNDFTKETLSTKYISFINEISNENWIKYAIVKGLLNKFDYWSSSHTENPVEIIPKYSIREKVEDYMMENKMMKNEMQIFLENHENENTIIIASTGFGKTEGSLLWAKDAKTFYTLPLKVSINAMYQRIKYNYKFDEVSLLHSDVIQFLTDREGIEIDDSYERYKMSKNLSYPLAVCTVDQILTFCYRYAGSEILLSTLKYSKLIIDEIQSYSPDLLAKIIFSLKLLKEAGGKFLIMTATFPPVLKYFLEEEGVFTKDDFLNFGEFTSSISRHKIVLNNSDFDYDRIKKDGKSKKILVICNTVRKAQEVYEKLQDNNVWILHSRMTNKDRTIQEKRIFDFANSDSTGIWITTQVVEASIDVDFDVLYTEMSTADSLLQRLGRCYRKREYLLNEPNVYIYNTKNGLKHVYDEVLYERSVKFLKDYNEKIFTEKEKLEYINKVYDEKDPEMRKSQYFKDIKNTLERLKLYEPNDWDKKDAKNKFRDINSEKVIPKSIYDELVYDGTWDNWINDLKSSDKEIRLRAEMNINNYSVQIKLSKKIIVSHSFDDLKLKVVNLKYDFDTCGYGIGLGFSESELEDNYI